MKKNGHYSKLELYLEQFFTSNNIKYEPNYSKDPRYPFHCDFYLPEIDTFIEINNFWHHNSHFYDCNNDNDIKIANYWKEKSKEKPQYKVALEVWTIRDVNKRNCAIKNNLNYIVLWNKDDIDLFIKTFTNHIL